MRLNRDGASRHLRRRFEIRAACELNGANPSDYLIELQRHSVELRAHPSEWMPWNYRDTLARLAAPRRVV